MGSGGGGAAGFTPAGSSCPAHLTCPSFLLVAGLTGRWCAAGRCQTDQEDVCGGVGGAGAGGGGGHYGAGAWKWQGLPTAHRGGLGRQDALVHRLQLRVQRLGHPVSVQRGVVP